MADDRYEVHNADIEEKLRDLGKRIHAAIAESNTPKLCFLLLLFDLDTRADGNGTTFYISDAQRHGAVEALKEAVRRIEKQGVPE